MFLNLWYIYNMSSCVYIIFFELILTQLVMFGCLECSCPDTVKLILKVWLDISFGWSQRQIGILWSKSEMYSLHSDNKLDWLKVYRWLVAVCFDFIAHAHVWILGRQETLIALIIGQHLYLCLFYCLPRILACACAIKSKQTATSHLLPLSVTSCCTHRKRERKK